MKRWLGIVAMVCEGLGGCVASKSAPADGPTDTRPGVETPLSLVGDWSTEQAADVVWTQTAAGDEWRALELARREGPEGLLQQLERGGPAARAAVSAWPHVPSSWTFRGEWCSRAQRYAERDWAPLLLALSASSAQRDAVGEELSPEYLTQCERWLTRCERWLELDDKRLSAGDSGDFGAARDALAVAQSALSPRNVANGL